jgi:hypothetical protein
MSATFCICFVGEQQGWGILAALSEGAFKLVCSGCTQKDAEDFAARLNRDEAQQRKGRSKA